MTLEAVVTDRALRAETAANAAKAIGKTVDPYSDANVHIPDEPIAVVLAGAGARGAYEAGLVATLLPYLPTRPTIFVGTSAGAINAALLASVAHLPPEEARAEILRRWRTIRLETVLGPIWRSVSSAVIEFAGSLFFQTKCPNSLLDTAPLRESLSNASLIDWAQIATNVRTGAVHTLAVATTESSSGRTKIFYQSNVDESHPTDEAQAIDYVPTQLSGEHVLASAAIPVLFPAVRLKANGKQTFYVDGGVRLNAPLKPAIAFGANGVIVISTDPRRYGTSDAVDGESAPSFQDQILQFMRGTFADRMIEDLQVLMDKNNALLSAREGNLAGIPPKNRYVAAIFGGPNDRDRVGAAARLALERILRTEWIPGILGGLLKHPELTILSWLTKPSPESGPDLLSYVLFEPEFINQALNAGISDANALLKDYPDPKELWDALRRIGAMNNAMTLARRGSNGGREN